MVVLEINFLYAFWVAYSDFLIFFRKFLPFSRVFFLFSQNPKMYKVSLFLELPWIVSIS